MIWVIKKFLPYLYLLSTCNKSLSHTRLIATISLPFFFFIFFFFFFPSSFIEQQTANWCICKHTRQPCAALEQRLGWGHEQKADVASGAGGTPRCNTQGAFPWMQTLSFTCTKTPCTSQHGCSCSLLRLGEKQEGCYTLHARQQREPCRGSSSAARGPDAAPGAQTRQAKPQA